MNFYRANLQRWPTGAAKIILLLLLICWPGAEPAAAQEPLRWSPQQQIPGYDDDADTPVLITDQNHTVHAFNAVQYETEAAIVYSTWTLQDGWSDPVDVLLPVLNAESRMQGAVLDPFGIVHVIYFSGNDLNANIYYAQAPLAAAGNAASWTSPELIGESAITPDEAKIAVDSQGRLFVLYSGDIEGNGLYAVHSLDGGNTWTTPVPMGLTYSDELWSVNLKMYTDNEDNIHALWSEGNPTGNSERILYSKVSQGEEQWTEPYIFSTEFGGFETDTPNIIQYNNELIVIYHNDFPTTRYMRRSMDFGRTWSEPVNVFPRFVGSNGPASFAIDSNNTLYAFFGNRTGNPIINGMWYSVWLGDTWSPEYPVISKDQLPPGTGGFDPSFANAVVSQGNVLLVSWTTDPQAGLNGAWYAYTVLDTPEYPVVELPAPPPTATPFPTSTPRPPAPTPTPLPTRPSFEGEVNQTAITEASVLANPVAPLFVGIIPIIFLISVVFIASRFHFFDR